MGTTPGSAKDKKARRKEDRDRRRGRSRERRADKDDRRSAKEPKRSKEEKDKARSRRRSRSRSSRPAVLVAAAAAEARPADSKSVPEKSDHGPGSKGVERVPLGSDTDDDDEEDESEQDDDEDEIVDVEQADKKGPVAPEPPALEPNEPPVKVVSEPSLPRQPDESHDKSRSHQRHDRTAPEQQRRGVSLLRSRRPRSPEQPQRTRGTGSEHGDEGADPKFGKYTCRVCNRQVGGGLAGSFQHKRSPFHLASWVWNNQSSAKHVRTWKQCQKDGEVWSAALWKEGTTGPSELNEKTARQSRPPVERSDPEKKNEMVRVPTRGQGQAGGPLALAVRDCSSRCGKPHCVSSNSLRAGHTPQSTSL